MNCPRNVVVIGAAFRGVIAIVNIAQAWPAQLPVAVLIALSAPEQPRSIVLQILEGYAPVPVAYAKEEEVAKPGRIYLSPPDSHMVVGKDGTLKMQEPGLFDSSHPSVDRLFTSASKTFGCSLIGIVLNGCERDGIQGLRDIEAAGGIAIAQQSDDLHERNARGPIIGTDHTHYRVAGPDIAPLVKRLVAAGAVAS